MCKMTDCKKSKTVLDTKILGLEDKYFCYGSNIQRNWIEVARSLLDMQEESMARV